MFIGANCKAYHHNAVNILCKRFETPDGLVVNASVYIYASLIWRSWVQP